MNARNSGNTRRPRNWTVQGSMDGTSWDILHSVTNGFGAPYTPFEMLRFKVTTHGYYKHYRLHVTANYGDGNHLDIEQWNLFSSRIAYADTPSQPQLVLDTIPRLLGGSMTSPGGANANVISISDSYTGSDTVGSVSFVNATGTSIQTTTETYLTTTPIDHLVSKIQRTNAVSTPIVRSTTSSSQQQVPTVCYSLQKKVPGYVGPLCRVRRVSDGVTQDIYGFTNTDFLDSGEMRVVTWYDQSGNQTHAAAPTPETQPLLRNTPDQGWVMDLDGTSFSNRKYFEMTSTVAAQAVWSQFQVNQFNPNGGYATLFTYSGGAKSFGVRFEDARLFDPNNSDYFVYPSGSQVWWNGTIYTSPSAENPSLGTFTQYKMLAYRNTSTQNIDRIGRTNWNDSFYRDFTGYIKEFFIYGSFDSSSLTSQAQALTQASTTNVARVGLLGGSRADQLVNGFIQRSGLSMEEICQFIVSTNLPTGLYSSETELRAIGSGVRLDYYIHRGDLLVSDVNALFTTVKDIRPAFIIVDSFH
jgi:hypothetical protein